MDLEEERVLAGGGGSEEVIGWRILETLQKIGPAARAAVPMLTNHLSSTDETISVLSAEALWAIEPHNSLSIPCFIEKLTPEAQLDQNRAHYSSLLALAKIGPEARAALPYVRNFLGDNDLQTQMAATVAAWRLDPSGPPPIDLLEGTFHSEVHIMYRRTAIELLGDLGPPARAAIPTLTEATKEPDELMREDARVALRQVEAD
jgi:HEAT repeat protein